MDSMEKFIVDKATNAGLPMPLRPTAEPEMPRDLTDLPPKSLLSLMAEFSSLMAYAGAEAAKAGATYAAKKAKYKFNRAKKFVESKASAVTKLTDKALEYKLDCDEELDVIKREEVSAEQYKTLVDALYEGYSAKAGVLSRELTRRGMKGSDF